MNQQKRKQIKPFHGRIKTLLEEGVSRVKIAEFLEVNYGSLCQYIDRHNDLRFFIDIKRKTNDSLLSAPLEKVQTEPKTNTIQVDFAPSKETTTKEGDGGLKFDTQKTPLALLPLSILEGVARVFEFGAKKYGAFNWTKFEPTFDNRVRFTSALLRHLSAYQTDPFSRDEESNLLHIDHVIWNGIMLRYLTDEESNNLPF